MIALVQRPRRRMHLARSHGPEWWTVCDRIVQGAGARVLPVDLALVGTVEQHADQLCAECHRMLVFAGTVAAANGVDLARRLELAS